MIPTPVQGPARDAVAIIAQRLVAWGLPPDDAAFALQGAVHWRDVAPREYLFTQDAPVTAIYLLVEGRVLQEKIIEDGQGNRRVILRREAQPGESATEDDDVAIGLRGVHWLLAGWRAGRALNSPLGSSTRAGLARMRR